MALKHVLASAVIAAGLAAGIGVASVSGTSPAPAAAAAESGAYKVDPVHSSIIFGIKHLGVANVYGRFNHPEGTFLLDGENPGNSVIDISVKAENVDTANEGRDRHLRSPDFFSAREFPTISFKSTEVRRAGENSFEVTGDLSMHGRTRSITVTLEKTGTGTHPRSGAALMGFETRFTVNRMDYGISYMPDGLGHEVSMIVSIEGIRE